MWRPVRHERSRRRVDSHVRRDVALVVLSAAASSAAYWAAGESASVRIAAVLAVTSATSMHARLAMDRVRTVIQVIVQAGVVSAFGATPGLVIGMTAASLAGAECVVRSSGRAGILHAGPCIAIAGAAGLFLADAATSAASRALPEMLAATAGSLLGVPLLLAFGPFAERLLGHTTRLTLTEWLTYEHPLLRRLANAAPGTFQHSINVGVLADAAARAVGRDALLARVGGLYHDVGKMNAPEYFVENQHGSNPHDALAPSESARIVRAHVTDGIDLIAAHRMGDRIMGFAREHHGTGCMRLFQDKAAALGAPAAGEGDIYCYPGPRPQSPESAIVMIADQLEATARSAPPSDERACQDIVDKTVARLRDEQQLDESGLTSGDLQKVSAALSAALMAMHHRRMTYPPTRTTSPPRRRLTLIPRLIGRARS